MTKLAESELNNIALLLDTAENKGGEVISLREARLQKALEKLRSKRTDTLEGFGSEIRECRAALNELSDIIGEINESSTKSKERDESERKEDH